ncbi:P-loop containing nucleoside triphosphate hydrolase protein [Lepidopterella palustris CBS 459.81]|uniref:P-loop containing nucleoside triphosphate hydrolase protein n=1 Tax=Lepidopterella palustris CBS 459.81 TaxID=1314670 RepID=A0A8E2ELB5_9PEZI|nr:P-loop containing nucleoside triphosphate hydrolase protein [Lepidopterella palustris CBS 459.81]
MVTPTAPKFIHYFPPDVLTTKPPLANRPKDTEPKWPPVKATQWQDNLFSPMVPDPHQSTNLFPQLINFDQDEVAEMETSGELNSQIAERFSIRETCQVDGPPLVPIPNTLSSGAKYNPQIGQYFQTANHPVAGGEWLSKSEFPTSAEILKIPDGVPQSNKILGSYESTEKYLKTQYELSREDAVRPLREAVGKVRKNPHLQEDEYGGGVGIYENVHFTAVTCSPRGLALRIAFSLSRVGKRIRWEQSKRLITGSLVALTPFEDMFKSKCIIATVAARPIVTLEQNPPEISLFFARPEEIEHDTAQAYVMVEERTSFYEASRYTMLALQKLMREPFPLVEHLVGVKHEVEPPLYVKNKPHTDLSSIVALEEAESFENVNILEEWPETTTTGLDTSQSFALKRILTKQLAIIHGPPGTGKTHVSVVALKALLNNMTPEDPPIIAISQTNHAIDQLLRHVVQFESKVVRLGGRSKDQDVIKKRTLYEVRKSTTKPKPSRSLRASNQALAECTASLQMLLAPLEANMGPLDHKLLAKLDLLSRAQVESLENGCELIFNGRNCTPMEMWMGKSLVPVQRNIQPDHSEVEYEEADLEFEQLKELEAEAFADDDDIETLKGPVILLGDNYTGMPLPGITDEEIRQALNEQDLWKIHQKMRGPIYSYLQRHMKDCILTAFRNEAKRYEKFALQRRIGMWQQDSLLLANQKLVGMTTTGMSKYRALVASLNPKVVLVEEAAETLEAPLTAACLPSLEHLILVGDHKQLRPHCQVKEHEGDPYNLDLSLFERMVNNGVEFDSLRRQRRMIPEIRYILKPIYGDLISDHPTVKDPKNRPPVEGMGGCNTFFFSHEWPESQDRQMSFFNQNEAEMIVGFFDYLVCNGVKAENITVLTFYNGQRKHILRRLRDHPNLKGTGFFKVVTVDSYQGEENDIILLSLVRSNSTNKIGFLNVSNRICVSLSRAKRGFYAFGNGELLCGENMTWAGVVEKMYGKKGDKPKTGPAKRVGFNLPLQCKKHGRKTFVQEPTDWTLVNGGCELPCRCQLPCGHTCMLKCHPFDRALINCTQKCLKNIESCGHPCSTICCDPCRCTICDRRNVEGRALLKQVPKNQMPFPRQTMSAGSARSDVTDWANFANGGVRADDAAKRDLTRKILDQVIQSRLDDQANERLFENSTKVTSASLTPPTRVSQVQSNSNLLVDLSDNPSPPRMRWQQKFVMQEPRSTSKAYDDLSVLD